MIIFYYQRPDLIGIPAACPPLAEAKTALKIKTPSSITEGMSGSKT
jgi:hypothetical protein